MWVFLGKSVVKSRCSSAWNAHALLVESQTPITQSFCGLEGGGGLTLVMTVGSFTSCGLEGGLGIHFGANL